MASTVPAESLLPLMVIQDNPETLGRGLGPHVKLYGPFAMVLGPTVDNRISMIVIWCYLCPQLRDPGPPELLFTMLDLMFIYTQR